MDANPWTRIRRILAARWAHPVNWSLRQSGLALLVLGLLLRSGTLGSAGIVLACASALDFRTPAPRWRLVAALQAKERAWLDAPWTWRRRLALAALVLAGCALLLVPHSDSLAVVLALAGCAGLWAAHRATRRQLKDIDRDAALDKLLEDQAEPEDRPRE